MNVTSLINDIRSRKFKPVYLLHGEEPYYIDLISDTLESTVLNEMQKGFDQAVYYGKDIDMTSITNACRRYPMMGDYQLILIKEAQDLKWKLDENILLKYIENLTPTTILVLEYKYAKFDKRKKLYKAIDKTGAVIESNKLYDNQVAPWIESFLKERGRKVHPQASALMSEYLGNNLSKIANELEKLLLNVGNNNEITLKEVEENIGISKEYNIFEFNTALGKRDAVKAIQIADYFAANPKNHPIPVMVGMTSAYFTKILKYHYLPNKNPQLAAKELGVHPFFVKEYEIAARNFSKAKLFEVIHQLKTYDLRFKGVEVGPLTTDGELLRELVFKVLS